VYKIRPHKLFPLVQSTSYLDRMVQVVFFLQNSEDLVT
jgi:hypothetical protein